MKHNKINIIEYTTTNYTLDKVDVNQLNCIELRDSYRYKCNGKFCYIFKADIFWDDFYPTKNGFVKMYSTKLDVEFCKTKLSNYVVEYTDLCMTYYHDLRLSVLENIKNLTF